MSRSVFRFTFIAICFLCFPFNTEAHTFQQKDSTKLRNGDKRIHSFNLQNVQLNYSGASSPLFKEAEETDLKYLLALDPDKLLAPFQREAGLPPKASSYGNWENTGLDGHIGGHYLSALALMYASTQNQEMLVRLNYMIEVLKNCQDKNGDGYIGGVPGSQSVWNEVANGKIEVSNFSLNNKWVPWYNLHKLFAGLRDAYWYAGNQQAKEMLIKLTDWCVKLTSNLDEKQMQRMLQAEHGGMNEVIADVAVITGDKKYLDLAKRFSHKAILTPLVQKKDSLTGLHANTQIPKVIGFKRIADITSDEKWNDAAQFFWETVVTNRTIAIGGNSVREHFNPLNNFSSMITDIQGPETCNTYNMLRLTKMLYESTGSTRYIDYYERALYNHILSTQHPRLGGFVYFTPMRPGHYRVYSQPETSMWCCVGSGLENHAKYGELIYAHQGDHLFVNLFIASTLSWKEKNITVKQSTKFPDEEKTEMIVHSKKKIRFTMHVRYPFWVESGKLQISINGKELKASANPDGYVSVERHWKDGDKVTVGLPARTTVEQMPDQSDYFAVLHGPVVLAAKTDTSDLKGLFADDSRGGHVASGKVIPLQQTPFFVVDKNDIPQKIKSVKGKPLTFTASELIYPEHYKNLELIPFFRLHDSRYVIYWKTLTSGQLKEHAKALAKQHDAEARLAEKTIDTVAPGEQQPESDHFIQFDRSDHGMFQDRYWRQAKGWFSYKLRDADKKASTLQVTYHGLDKNRRFDILMNNIKIATVNLTGEMGDRFYTVDYVIPADAMSTMNAFAEVKFVAHDDSMTGRIFYVRLLR